MSDDYHYYDDYALPQAEEDDDDDETGTRTTWKILTWILVVLTLVLNLLVIGILLIRRNVYSIVNKSILTVAILDLLYGIFVSPFMVENYVEMDWDRGIDYCRFFIYYFTFHDFFVPLILILTSTYISLKYAGVTEELRLKRPLYIGFFGLALLLSFFLSIPATVHTVIIEKKPDNNDVEISECRSRDSYTMVMSYFLSSSLLFCFTMSFLFSLCIVGSPFLRNLYDREEYSQRWRLLLTTSLVNIFYIITGFLLNFKEISRFLYKCCEFDEPYLSLNTLTYDVWSFVLLAAEPFFRPLMYLTFYFKYLLTDITDY